MKRILALTMAMAMIFAMFSGCAKPEGDGKTTAGGGDSVASKGSDKNVRTDIVISDGFDVVTFDPPEITDVYSSEIAQMMYDRLVMLDENSEIAPMLAESWEIASNTEYVFKLHEGVKFHNGDEMKASDVAFSLNRARANPKSQTALEAIESVTAIDDYTVSVKTFEPFAPMLLNLCGNNASVLSEKVVTEAEANGGTYGPAPIGTGPMMFDSYRPNDYTKMVRFDDYFDGLVKATSITRRVIPEESSRTIALENGEVDYLNILSSVDIERVKSNPDLKAVEMPSSNVAYIGLNLEKEPFTNKKVRQALHFAINKQDIVEVQYEGFGVESTSIFPNIMVGFDEDLNLFPYDIEKAKALLTEAGYPNGFDFEILVTSELRSRICQLIQQNYTDIGVNMEIAMVEFGTVLEMTGRGDYEAFLLGWSNATNPDSTVMSNFHSSKIGSVNRVRMNMPEIDKLIEDARTELDWAKREPMYKELQYKIMDECAWIPLIQQTYVAGMAAGVEGVEMYKTGSRYYRNMVVVED